MRHIRTTAGLLAALLLGGAAQAATIRLSCGAVGQELELCRSAAQNWAQRTGHTVEVVTTPADANERLTLYRRLLEARSDQVDVFQIDVVWPGLLERHLLDLKPYSKGIEQQHFGGVVSNNTVNGRLLAMPWFIDAGLLYYRRDLLAKYNLKPPRTWDDLVHAAKTVQAGERAAGHTQMWGYVWQGRAYEGLTCNALEWLISHGAGTVVDVSGIVTVRNSQAVKALQMAASWVGTISPDAVLSYGEEDARRVFQAGQAVFMRNWPYAWSLAQAADSPVKGKVGITVLPMGTGPGARFAATLGGQQLAVSKYSQHAALAAELVMYLTSAEVQKERAISGSFNPTLWPLYGDRDVLKAAPFMGELYGVFAFAVGRPAGPTGPRYQQVSEAFWNTAHQVLSRKLPAAEALNRLEVELARVGRGGKWD
ncbi:ABC transporter substrate-binding protein [Schlegelella sp. S2-27]|uniref:ABC transporter substrate-binding protein n=1 Tax=Caldimonas mangrovi TaxID=2944811 RepID=A0ABT0YJX6_9BURK|nr:ABC transporter substrate-binding protein [Caldimonas mangrovi]MCM5679030.1 ABC transporter substrate-binding protein [Caldimonas mangrovi]